MFSLVARKVTLVLIQDTHFFSLPGYVAFRLAGVMIHVRELTKTYADLRRGSFTAVDCISFDASPGQIYGLLGPNGAREDDCVAHPEHDVAALFGQGNDQRVRCSY